MDDHLSLGEPPWMLKDNCYGIEYSPKISYHSHVFLKPWSGTALEKWREMGVSVFTQVGGADDRSDRNLKFFTLGQEGNSHWIETHNCMGVIRLRNKETGNNIQIEIGSRFDSKDGKQFFLTYLLSKAFGGSFIDLVSIGNDSLWDLLLAFAFRRSLENAARLGPFKQYQSFQHNDLRIRGKIDVARHLRENIPFIGKVAHGTRDITYDNPTNHLIRHALAKLNRDWGSFFCRDHRLNELRRQLEQNTPTWQSDKLLDCLRKKENLKPIKHPYYQSAYEPLRTLSLSILRGEGASLYQTAQEAEGVIFDGSWLWEEYLWTLLKSRDFEHPENKAQTGPWNPLNGITYYPDFFHREKRVVLDAKYQRTCNDRKDNVRQVFAYMFVLDAVHGGLIKPDIGKSEPEKIERQVQDAKAAKWHEFGIKPPSHASEAHMFIDEMKLKEENFLKVIDSALGLAKKNS